MDPVYFWPHIVLNSNELILMAPQAIQDAHSKHGPYDFDPSPPPDDIARTVKRLHLEDGVVYEGEVDD